MSGAYLHVVSVSSLKKPNKNSQISNIKCPAHQIYDIVCSDDLVCSDDVVISDESSALKMLSAQIYTRVIWSVSRSLIDEKLDDGLTGKVRFNDLGDRLMPIYEIINVWAGNKQVVVGTYANNSVSISPGKK
jgi:hypothetical protein